MEALAGIKDKTARMELLARVNAPAYRYRLTRLGLLQDNVMLEVGKLSDAQLAATEHDVDKGVAGLNLPPMHPNCRSTTVSLVDKAVLDGMTRRAIDPVTGKATTVPASMARILTRTWPGLTIPITGCNIPVRALPFAVGG